MDKPLIGVACVVRKHQDRTVLIHKRKGDHAPGTHAFAGGHLEMWEDPADTAIRELCEEAGEDIKVTHPEFWTITNTCFYDEGKHYVVLFYVCDWIEGKPEVMEEDKCEYWEWYDWEQIPAPLMQGLSQLKDRGMDPFHTQVQQ